MYKYSSESGECCFNTLDQYFLKKFLFFFGIRKETIKTSACYTSEIGLKRIWLFIDRPRKIEYGYSKTVLERIWLFENWHWIWLFKDCLRTNMVIREFHGLELNMVIQRLFENEYGYSKNCLRTNMVIR